jgi:poly-gamma-glutamate synthesis protein (capsule biosynthesis protein)
MTLRNSLVRAAGGAVLLLVVAGSGSPSDPVAEPTPTPTSTSTASPTTAAPRVTPTPTATPEPEPREFTIVATGDVLLHERLWTQAQRDAGPDGTWDFAPQLASIAPIVDGADLSICHLETPLAPRGGPYKGYPQFSAPPQIVAGLVETGYTACSVASNHTFDQGGAGVDRTLTALDAAGLAHAGAARTPDEAAEPTLIDVPTGDGSVTVGLLSYAYGFNGIPYPNGDTWRANVIDSEAILGEARRAREAGAEFVVLALHWGTEYGHDPNEQQRALAPELIGSPDIDLVLGHHAHVVQPMERFGDEWVIYGMGNLMHAQKQPADPRHEGLLVRFTITENEGGGFAAAEAEYLPLYQTNTLPVGVVNVEAALDGGDTGTASLDRLEIAMDRTTEIVGRRGALDDGAHLLTNGE